MIKKKFLALRNKKFNSDKKGFTLFEVMAVLAVIGIMAAIVIPSVARNTENAELKTAWKSTYADIKKATDLLLLANYNSLKNICADNDNACFRDKYLPYFNYTKACPLNINGNCWPSKFYFGSGADLTPSWTDYSVGVILTNGVMIRFYYDSAACTAIPPLNTDCGQLAIDVNGFKGPNTLGKDIFRIHILENSIKPFGTQGDGKDNCNKGNYWGDACSAEYLYK